MPTSAAPRLSVSTWSLHRALGVTYPDAPGGNVRRGPVESYGPASLSLLEVPERIAAMGVHTLEICHFHLPSRDAGYFQELQSALDAARVELFSVLIDGGDITDPVHHARDLAWAGEWVDTAAALGAQRARVIAGKSSYSEEAMQRSIAGLRALAARGAAQGVRVTTENWYPLLSRPEAVLRLLDSLEGQVGLNLDFGNWSGPTKYDDLAAIFPRAESCHAKCAFTAPRAPDTEDFRRCLDLSHAAGLAGPYTLIYDGPGDDEWEGLVIERELVQPYLQSH